MNIDKKVCVIGLGYIGLPTAALLANRGYKVHGVDINQHVVETINKGKIHIKEPELDTFVRSAVRSGRLKADAKPAKADIFIIAVPTPFHNGYVPNIDFIILGTRAIAPYVEKGNIVILESTSPVGTTEKIASLLTEEGVDVSTAYIAYCPERVLPGRIMVELIENDRIVGGINDISSKKVSEFYKTFVAGEVFLTNSRTAEMIKLSENAFRDVNIAFANELSILCDRLGINIYELICLANRHPRVKILQPGCGVGGHCIAVDPWFIVHTGKEDARLIKTARMVNTYKAEWVIEKIKQRVLTWEKENQRSPRIACMGLTFKPDTDDLRESPALYIVKTLKTNNFDILAVEPNINKLNELALFDYRKAIDEADIVAFLVAHKEFRGIDIKNKVVLDFCGVTNK